MKRNFSNESAINYFLRAKRALSGRLRGKLLFACRAFAKGTNSQIFLGHGFRLINSKAILLGARVNFGVMARIECHGQDSTNSAGPLIKINDGTSFGDYFHAGAILGITIGKNVLGGSNILIVDHNHGNPSIDMKQKTKQIPRERPLSSKGPIIIEDNVWIGDNCVILGGTHVGEGAILAANSVVTGDISPFTTYFSR